MPTRKPGTRPGGRSYVIYGRSGTGKTTLACTFPKPLLLLDVNDHGDDSVVDVDGVDVMDCPDWEDFETAYWYIKANPKKFKTLVIDTASQLQMCAIKDHLQGKNKKTERAGDWGTMTKRDWGDVAAKMKTTITNLRNLPMDVVIIAQDRVFNVDEDDDDGESMIDPEVGPQLSPSVAKHLNASVAVIGNTFVRRRTRVKRVAGKKKEIKRIEYCLRIGPNPVYVTKIRKSRSVKPPSIIVDPDHKKIDGIIKGEEQ